MARQQLTRNRLPNLTEVERDAVVDPDGGDLVYNTTTGTYEAWDLIMWTQLLTASTTLTSGEVTGQLGGPLVVQETHSGSSHADVQAAAEATSATALAAHVATATDAHDASAVSIVASGFDGALNSSVVNAQVLAQMVDDIQGVQIPVDANGFFKNLSPSVVNVQLLAQAVDNLPLESAVTSVNGLVGDVIISALDIDAIPNSARGVPSGVAELDITGVLTVAQRFPHVSSINGYSGSVDLVASDIPIDAEAYVGGNLDNTVVNVQLLADAVNALTISGGGGGAPTDVGYLVTAASGGLSAEVVVGTAPGGELGGTWASPTVDTVHAGSSHASILTSANAYTDAHVTDATAAHAASAISFTPTGTIASTDMQSALAEVASEASSSTINASGFGINLATTDDTLQEIANKVNIPPQWTIYGAQAPPLSEFDGTAAPLGPMNVPSIFVASHVTLTSSPTTIGQGTPLLVHFDQDLEYTEGTLLGPNYGIAYRPTAWDATNYSNSHYPRGVVTVEGISRFHKPASLLATGLSFLDIRATQNAPKRAPRSVTGGATTSGSPNITGNTFSSLDVGNPITGTNIPVGASINAVTDSTHATLSASATGTSSGLTFTVTDQTPAISNAHSYLNNHVYLADTDAVNWAIPVDFTGGAETIVAMLNCYPSGGFIDQPTFTPHHVNGGTLTNASTVSFMSAPLVYAGVHMNQRWGYYYEDTMDTTIGTSDFNWMDLSTSGPGTIDRQVAIQIGVLRSAVDYNIPINYGDANVANAPLFRVDADGSVTALALYGANVFNLLTIAPGGDGDSTGVLVADMRGMLYGPINGYTHNVNAAYQLMTVGSGTITMDSATGINNSFAGVALIGTISFNKAGSTLGSAMFSATNVFTNTGGIAMGTVYGMFVSPAFTGVNTTSVTSVGYSGAPSFTHTGTGTFTVSSLTTLQSSPTVNDAAVAVTARTAIRIDEINGSSDAGIASNIGIDIAAFTRGTTKIGIQNASTTVLSGGVYGSTASGGDLDVRATTHATAGSINLHDETELRPTDQTFMATPNWFLINNAYTMNMASAAVGAFISVSPTVIMQQSGSISGSVVGATLAPTVKNSGNANLGLVFGEIIAPTLTADTNTNLSATVVSLTVGPSYTPVSSGTITSGAVTNVLSSLALGTGMAPTGFTHVSLSDPTGAGSVNGTVVGLDVAAFTKGTTNVGIRNLSSSLLTGIVEFGSSVEHRAADATFTAAQTWYVVNNTYTMNMASGNVGTFFDVAPTIVMQQAGAIGSGLGYRFAPTVKNSGVVGMGLLFGSIMGPTFTGDSAASSASFIGYTASPSYGIAGGGSIGSGTATGFSSSGTLVTGVTQSQWTHYSVSDVTGTGGTLTLQVGLDIPALTKGVTNYGIRSASPVSITSTLNVTSDTTLNKLIVTSTITTEGGIELRPSDQTFTSTPDWLFLNNTYTMNMVNGNYGGFVTISPTVIMQQSGYAFGAGTSITIQPTIRSTTASTNLGLNYGIFANPIMNATGSGVTGITGSLTTYYAGPSATGTSSGTLAMSGVTNFQSAFTLNGTGSTLTTLTHFAIANATITAGTITTQVGLDIATLSGAGTNIGIRLGDGNSVVVGTSTGTKIGTATGQKIGFWNATPIIQPANANQAAVGTTAPAGGTGTAAGGWSTAANRDTAITTINSLVTLVNQLRSDLVAAGIIKGSA